MTRLYRLLAAVVVLVTLAACSSAAKPHPSDLVDAPSSGPYQGVGMLPAQPRPSFMLTDTAGRGFSFGQVTSGHPTLLFFGYTQCPDVCPTTMADIRTALARLPLAEQQKVYVVFVSTDVRHDTAAVVRTWMANFTAGVHATFVGLIGTQAQIDAAQTAAHITLATDGGQTHSARVLLYGADNYARVSFLQGSDEAQEMAHDLPLVS